MEAFTALFLSSFSGVAWQSVCLTTAGNGGRDAALVAATGRYLRVRCLESSAGAGYSLRELNVLSDGMTSPIFPTK